MSLRNMVLLTGDPMVVTPGPTTTEKELALSPVTIQNGLQLIYVDDVAQAFRRSVTFRSRPAIYDPKSKTWSKQKRSVTFSSPIQGTDNAVQSAAIRIEVDVPAAFETASIEQLLDGAIQALASTDLHNFWTIGTVE